MISLIERAHSVRLFGSSGHNNPRGNGIISTNSVVDTPVGRRGLYSGRRNDTAQTIFHPHSPHSILMRVTRGPHTPYCLLFQLIGTDYMLPFPG